MRYIKYAPRLTPINEDLTASMMLIKRRNRIQQKRRVVEIVRVVGTPAVSSVSPESTPTKNESPAAESPSNESASVTLEPLRNRADTALTAPAPQVHPTTTSNENKYGRSALHVAVRKGDVAAVKHLIATQPELLRRPDVRGNEPLHYAANAVTKNSSEIVFCLLKAGALVNAANERGQTALLIHVISNANDDDMVARLLLHNNAKPQIKVTETMLLSQYAAVRGLSKVATALNEYM